VLARKLRAAVTGAAAARGDLHTRALALVRAEGSLSARRDDWLASHAAALRAHDPERTLERGYALVLDRAGEPLATAAAVRAAETFDLRLADGTLGARVSDDRTKKERAA
jgi:exodeoxyribonuclease VII large subunit